MARSHQRSSDDTPELFDPKTNTIEALTNINTSQVDEVEYPQSTMLPGGKIMSISAEHGPIMILDPAAKTWTQVGTTQVPFGAWTSFAPGKYLITGGGVFIPRASRARRRSASPRCWT